MVPPPATARPLQEADRLRHLHPFTSAAEQARRLPYYHTVAEELELGSP